MKNLNDLSKSEFVDFIDSFDYAFFDVDGVLHVGRSTIPGADLCVKSLRKLGKQIAIVSNNSVLPRKMAIVVYKDFEVVAEEIVIPSEPVVDYLIEVKFDKSKDIFYIGGENTKQLLKNAGFNVVQNKIDEIENSFTAAKNDCLETMEDFPNVGVVIVDPDINMSMPKINRVVTILNQKKDVVFLYGAADESGPITKEINVPAFRWYMDAIKLLTSRQGLSYAKPSKLLADHLNQKFKVANSKRVLFVGDNLHTDIEFGVDYGYQTLLVLSGNTSPSDVKDLEVSNARIKPDFYIRNLKDLHELLLKHYF